MGQAPRTSCRRSRERGCVGRAAEGEPPVLSNAAVGRRQESAEALWAEAALSGLAGVAGDAGLAAETGLAAVAGL
jgi:hypothetical protein